MPKAMTVSCIADSISRMPSARSSIQTGLLDGTRRWDYGEDRYQLLGAIERRVFVLISTLRDVPMFEELMKDGSQWGLDLSYRVQP